MFCSCSIESMQFTSRFVWICSGGSCVSKRKRTRELVVGVTYLELGFALLPREGRLSKLRMEATYLSWEYEELAKGCVCVCVCVCVRARALSVWTGKANPSCTQTYQDEGVDLRVLLKIRIHLETSRTLPCLSTPRFKQS